jgi:hypothetical protein
MMQSERPFDPARRLRSRLRYRSQLAVSASPSENSIARRHAAMTPFYPSILGTRDLYRSRKTQRNLPLTTTLMESVV